MKVRNMTSNRSGRPVANQFIIEGIAPRTFWDGIANLGEGEAFQSYSTIIAFRNYQGKLYLDRNSWDYSTSYIITFDNIFK